MKYSSEKNQPVRRKVIVFMLLLLVIILVVTNVWFLDFYVKNRDTNFSGVKNDKYSLLNPARNFFKQEDLIINFQPLRDYLNDKYEVDSDVSVYFEYLPTGANIAISKDAEFYPASLLKVPVAMAVAKKIEKEEWKWGNELVLMSADKDKTFGTLYKEPSNSTHTIEDLIRRSLVDSDNTAHFILLRNLELSEVSMVYDHMGLEDFMKSDGKISAKRYAVILRALYNSSYLAEENSQKILSYLTQSPFKDYIQGGLPQDVVFAHKIGISGAEKVFLDSGIVYEQNRPYLLTMMIKNRDEQKSKEIMKDISRKIFDYVRNYKD